MLIKSGDLKRLDLQLIKMFEDAHHQLRDLGIQVDDKFFINGFSASGSFANRFALLHPEKIKAVAGGGLNALLMLPKNTHLNKELPYPVGTNDIKSLTGKDFDLDTFSKLPQFYYMGGEDKNDAVPYNDAYNEQERTLIYSIYGETMMPDRWDKVQQIYQEAGINVTFKTYPKFGHRTSGEMNNEIAAFFKSHLD